MRFTCLLQNTLRKATLIAFISCLSLLSFNTHATDESPAELLGFQRVGDSLEFTVISTGCTTEKHFSLNIADTTITSTDEDNQTQSEKSLPIVITLVRTTNDPCRRMPGPRVIVINLPEKFIGVETIQITNSFVSLRSRG